MYVPKSDVWQQRGAGIDERGKERSQGPTTVVWVSNVEGVACSSSKRRAGRDVKGTAEVEMAGYDDGVEDWGKDKSMTLGFPVLMLVLTFDN